MKESLIRNPIGLCNQGATCYMNSVLQTLFLTPNFLKQLLNWKFNPNIHGNSSDSIPYQLQKLLSRLLLKNEHFVDTKSLIKSFQWNAQESFEENDVQEFIKVLFQAISLSMSDSTDDFISQLMEGELTAYIQCIECGYISAREEKYTDIQLPIQLFGQKEVSHSIQESFEYFFRPEKLENDNKYQCPRCNKKTNALKGSRILKLPKILSLQLTRFSYDLSSQSRIKINSFVSFPFILNMNFYLTSDFKQLISLNEVQQQNIISLFKIKEPEDFNHQIPNNNIEEEEEKINPIEKNFNQMIMEESEQIRKEVDDFEKKHIHSKSFLKKKNDLAKAKEIKKGISKGSKKPIREFNKEINPDFFAGAEHKQKPTGWSCNIEINPNNPLDNPALLEKIPELTKPKKIDKKKTEENVQELAQKDEKEIFQMFSEQKSKYEKESEYVYELYAILVHSGGAYGGHYFAYIKDIQTQKWYKFNDSLVTRVGLEEIKICFGSSKGLKAPYGAPTAYLLYYYWTKMKIDICSAEDIPPVLRNEIEKDYENLLKGPINSFEMDDKPMQLKIYYKKCCKVIKIKKKGKYIELINLCINEFNLKCKTEDCRIRNYNYNQDSMQETYNAQEETALDELRIYPFKCLALEVKNSEEKFLEYDPNVINIIINIWASKMELVKKIKIQFNQNSTLKELIKSISEITQIEEQNLIISKKNVMTAHSTVEIISIESYFPRTLMSLRVNDGVNLYVEDSSISINKQDLALLENKKIKTKWELEFEKEKNLCTIKFNNPFQPDDKDPSNMYTMLISYDRRKTIGEFKIMLSSILNIDPNNLIIKRGGIHGIELKDNTISLKNAHIFNLINIYIQIGVAAKTGEERLSIFLSKAFNTEGDSFTYEFQKIWEGIIEVSISVEQFKAKLCEDYLKDLKLKSSYIRIREKYSDRMQRVFKSGNLLSSYNMYTGKELAIQILDVPEDIKEEDVLISARTWNPANWNLSNQIDIILKKSITLHEMALYVGTLLNINPETISASKINSWFAFSRVQLPYEQWTHLFNSNAYISSLPLFIVSDGTLIIFKDELINPRELTEEEKKKYAAFDYELQDIQVSMDKTQRKEKALKITVKNPIASTYLHNENKNIEIIKNSNESSYSSKESSNNLNQSQNLLQKNFQEYLNEKDKTQEVSLVKEGKTCEKQSEKIN